MRLDMYYVEFLDCCPHFYCNILKHNVSATVSSENHLPLWDEVKIIDREEHWKRRHLKEAAYMLGYSDILSRPSIEMNTIWEPIIEKARLSCF